MTIKEVENKLNNISKELKKAEREKNIEKVSNLIEQFNKLAKELVECQTR